MCIRFLKIFHVAATSALLCPPPPSSNKVQQQQRTTKKKTLKTKKKTNKSKSSKMVSECTICMSFRGRARNPPPPPPYFLFWKFTHAPEPPRLVCISLPYGSRPICSFWIRDWQCSMYYYGYDSINLHSRGQNFIFNFHFFCRGGGGLSPHQREESPFPNLNPMYPPNSALRVPTPPLNFGWLLDPPLKGSQSS